MIILERNYQCSWYCWCYQISSRNNIYIKPQAHRKAIHKARHLIFVFNLLFWLWKIWEFFVLFFSFFQSIKANWHSFSNFQWWSTTLNVQKMLKFSIISTDKLLFTIKDNFWLFFGMTVKTKVRNLSIAKRQSKRFKPLINKFLSTNNKL